MEVAKSNVKVALIGRYDGSLSGRVYNSLFYISRFDVVFQAANLYSDFIKNTGEIKFIPDQFERLIFDHAHVTKKPEYLVKRHKRDLIYEENMKFLRIVITTCKQLADGDQRFIKVFLGVCDLNPKYIIDAKNIYSKLDVDNFL